MHVIHNLLSVVHNFVYMGMVLFNKKKDWVHLNHFKFCVADYEYVKFCKARNLQSPVKRQ